MNENVKKIIKEYGIYVIIIIVVVLIRTFIVTPIKVNGSSMHPTLENGNYMILKKYAKNSIERFDIVVVKRGKEKLIKRVIGLPKEDVAYRDDVLYINGEILENEYGYGYTSDFIDYCAEGEYYVLGDNREDSVDSRVIGCVKKEDILGTTNFVVFPFGSWGKVE